MAMTSDVHVPSQVLPMHPLSRVLVMAGLLFLSVTIVLGVAARFDSLIMTRVGAFFIIFAALGSLTLVLGTLLITMDLGQPPRKGIIAALRLCFGCMLGATCLAAMAWAVNMVET